MMQAAGWCSVNRMQCKQNAKIGQKAMDARRQRGGKTHNPSSASSLPLMCNFTAAGRALLLRLY
jgi:hypothetical protein